MVRFSKLIFAIYLCTVIMCGCGKENAKPLYQAVTQIDIVTQYKDQLIHRRYNTPNKMRPVLLYLRLLKPQGKPIEVDNSAADIYLISISLSDGSKHYYRQASHRYLSKNNGPWKAIDPAQAAQLYSIMRSFSSDI